MDLICSRNVAIIFWYGSSVLLASLSVDGRLSSVCSETGLPPSLVEQFKASSAAATALLAAVRALSSCLADAVVVLEDAIVIEDAMLENARSIDGQSVDNQRDYRDRWLEPAAE